VHRFQADARRRCASARSPEGARSSAQRVGADALRHCPLDRFRSDVVTDAGDVSTALPLAAARIRDELEVASPRSSLRTPATMPPRPGACAPQRFDTAADSARVASDPYRASKATGCHGLPSPSALACAKAPHRHEVPARTDEDVGSSSEEPAPNRSAHGHATRFAPHKRSTQRLESSTSPPKATRAIVGWRPKRGSVQYGTPRDAVKRRAATLDPTRCSEPAPRGPARRRNTFGGAQPTAELGHRSEARSLLTPSSCPKMLPSPCRPRCDSLANSPPTWNRERLRQPEGHLRHRNSERRADARRPPCGGLPTPEPARSSKRWTPD
jgi:hypothetical protein